MLRSGPNLFSVAVETLATEDEQQDRLGAGSFRRRLTATKGAVGERAGFGVLAGICIYPTLLGRLRLCGGQRDLTNRTKSEPSGERSVDGGVGDAPTLPLRASRLPPPSEHTRHDYHPLHNTRVTLTTAEPSSASMASLGITLKPDLNRKDTLKSQKVVQGIQAGLAAGNSRVLDLFRAWDTNHDGRISREEFINAFHEMAPDFSESLVSEAFIAFDPNGDGEIEFSELHQLLRRRDGVFASNEALLSLEALADQEARKQVNRSSRSSAGASAISNRSAMSNRSATSNRSHSSPKRSEARLQALADQKAAEEKEVAELRALLARTDHVPAPGAFKRVGLPATAPLQRLDDGQNDDIATLRKRRMLEEKEATESTGRPKWDSSVWMYVPAALKGLKPVTPEPWARDGEVYTQGMNAHGAVQLNYDGTEFVDASEAVAMAMPKHLSQIENAMRQFHKELASGTTPGASPFGTPKATPRGGAVGLLAGATSPSDVQISSAVSTMGDNAAGWSNGDGGDASRKKANAQAKKAKSPSKVNTADEQKAKAQDAAQAKAERQERMKAKSPPKPDSGDGPKEPAKAKKAARADKAREAVAAKDVLNKPDGPEKSSPSSRNASKGTGATKARAAHEQTVGASSPNSPVKGVLSPSMPSTTGSSSPTSTMAPSLTRSATAGGLACSKSKDERGSIQRLVASPTLPVPGKPAVKSSSAPSSQPPNPIASQLATAFPCLAPCFPKPRSVTVQDLRDFRARK